MHVHCAYRSARTCTILFVVVLDRYRDRRRHSHYIITRCNACDVTANGHGWWLHEIFTVLTTSQRDFAGHTCIKRERFIAAWIDLIEFRSSCLLHILDVVSKLLHQTLVSPLIAVIQGLIKVSYFSSACRDCYFSQNISQIYFGLFVSYTYTNYAFRK